MGERERQKEKIDTYRTMENICLNRSEHKTLPSERFFQKGLAYVSAASPGKRPDLLPNCVRVVATYGKGLMWITGKQTGDEVRWQGDRGRKEGRKEGVTYSHSLEILR